MHGAVVSQATPESNRGDEVEVEVDDGVRVEVLRRLAEQAMNDADFRAVAREDLDRALDRWDYDLNPCELALVRRFRASLAEARIDLDLVADFGDDQLRRLLGS